MADPVITEKDLDEIQALFNTGDRTGVYLKYFELTGSEQAIMEANISTFSNTIGSAANYANDIANFADAALGNTLGHFMDVGNKYNLSVEEFSKDITAGLLVDMHEKLEKTGNAYVTDAEMRESAKNVWVSKGLGGQGIIGSFFPGEPLIMLDKWAERDYLEVIKSALSPGTAYSIASMYWNYTGSALWRAASLEPTDASPIKSEDFKLNWEMGPRYQIREVEHDGKEIFYIVDTQQNNKAIHIFDQNDWGFNGFVQGKAWVDISSPDIPVGGYVILPYNMSNGGTWSVIQKLEDPKTGHVYLKEDKALLETLIKDLGLDKNEFPLGTNYSVIFNGKEHIINYFNNDVDEALGNIKNDSDNADICEVSEAILEKLGHSLGSSVLANVHTKDGISSHTIKLSDLKYMDLSSFDPGVDYNRDNRRNVQDVIDAYTDVNKCYRFADHIPIAFKSGARSYVAGIERDHINTDMPENPVWNQVSDWRGHDHHIFDPVWFRSVNWQDKNWQEHGRFVIIEIPEDDLKKKIPNLIDWQQTSQREPLVWDNEKEMYINEHTGEKSRFQSYQENLAKEYPLFNWGMDNYHEHFREGKGSLLFSKSDFSLENSVYTPVRLRENFDRYASPCSGGPIRSTYEGNERTETAKKEDPNAPMGEDWQPPVYPLDIPLSAANGAQFQGHWNLKRDGKLRGSAYTLPFQHFELHYFLEPELKKLEEGTFKKDSEFRLTVKYTSYDVDVVYTKIKDQDLIIRYKNSERVITEKELLEQRKNSQKPDNDGRGFTGSQDDRRQSLIQLRGDKREEFQNNYSNLTETELYEPDPHHSRLANLSGITPKK